MGAAGVVGRGSRCGREENLQGLTRGSSPRLPWAGDGVKAVGLGTGVEERQCPCPRGGKGRGVDPGWQGWSAELTRDSGGCGSFSFVSIGSRGSRSAFGGDAS